MHIWTRYNERYGYWRNSQESKNILVLSAKRGCFVWTRLIFVAVTLVFSFSSQWVQFSMIIIQLRIMYLCITVGLIAITSDLTNLDLQYTFMQTFLVMNSSEILMSCNKSTCMAHFMIYRSSKRSSNAPCSMGSHSFTCQDRKSVV